MARDRTVGARRPTDRILASATTARPARTREEESRAWPREDTVTDREALNWLRDALSAPIDPTVAWDATDLDWAGAAALLASKFVAVYAVCYDIPGDPGNIFGLYSTRELAETAARERANEATPYRLIVQEWPLDPARGPQTTPAERRD